MKLRNNNNTFMTRRQVLACGTALSVLGACSSTPMAGRSERDPIEGGIGGTGIVGLVTGFGSLIVNGIIVDTTGATQYSTALGFTSASSVRVGDSLTIEATTRGGRLEAKRVHLTHPLVGQVQSVSADGTTLWINGVQVQLEPQIRGLAATGDRLRVSGLWRGNAVVASRLAKDTSGTDVIAGEAIGTGMRARIGGSPIVASPIMSNLRNGRYATAIGTFDGKQMNATRVVGERFVGAAGDLRQLSIEGYLDSITAAPGFKVSGLGHSFVDTLNLSPFRTNRTIFEGAYSGKFAAERALVLPQSFFERSGLLSQRRSTGVDLDWLPT